jgi:hypothetical protein
VFYRMKSDLFGQTQHIYIVINSWMATCFGPSEPSLGQYLIHGHGAFHVANYVLMTIYVLCLKE